MATAGEGVKFSTDPASEWHKMRGYH